MITHTTIPENALDFAFRDDETYINSTKLLKIMSGVRKNTLENFIKKQPEGSYGMDNGNYYLTLKMTDEFCKQVGYEWLSEYLLELYTIAYTDPEEYDGEYKYDNVDNLIGDKKLTRANINVLADLTVEFILYIVNKKHYILSQIIFGKEDPKED